jgi:lysozyme family protein
MSLCDKVIDGILAAEGGYVNYPDDTGGREEYVL